MKRLKTKGCGLKMWMRMGVLTCVGLLGSCSTVLMDPAFTGDGPRSPGSEWNDKALGEQQGEDIPRASVNPFTEEDLSKTMPLSKLIDIALYNNPSTRASWNAARAAAFGYYASLSPYYPAIELSGDVEAQHLVGGTSLFANIISTGGGVVPSPNPSPAQALKANPVVPAGQVSPHSKTNYLTFYNELTANYLVFDFGGRSGQALLGYQTLKQANWQHNYTMQQVILSVLNNYTSYLGNKGLVEANEQNLKDAEVALKAAEVLRNARLATLTDVLQAQSSVQLARFNLEQAKGGEKTSFGDLLIVLGLSPNTPILVQDFPDELPIIEISGDVTTLLDAAIRKRPDLQAALAVVRQQEAQLAISYSSGMPTLTAAGSLAQSKVMHFASGTGTSINKNFVTGNSLSINWDFPIFQGFFYYNQQRQLRAQVKEALDNLDVQVAAVATEVVTNYYAFTTAVANLPNSKALLDASQRAYKGIVSQYKVGASSFLDMLNSLTTLSNARAQYVLTRAQWAASLANLAFSVGLLDDKGAHWENPTEGELSTTMNGPEDK